MNSKMKRRLIVVTGVIVVVLAIVLAIVGSSGAAKTISVKDALESDLAGERVQVSGNVVDNSFATVDGVLTFDIYDPMGRPGPEAPRELRRRCFVDVRQWCDRHLHGQNRRGRRRP